MTGTSIFVALLDEADKDITLIDTVLALREGQGRAQLSQVNGLTFSQIPSSPFAYWTSKTLLEIFLHSPEVANTTRSIKQGLATAEDFRFLRLWWEVLPQWTSDDHRWFPFAKGGAYSPYFSDIHLVVNWLNNGEHIKARINPETGKQYSNVWQLKQTERLFFFRPGLTWSLRSQRGFSIRPFSSGSIFGHKGPVVFVLNDDPDDLLALLAIMNAAPFHTLLDLQMAFGSFEVGVIQRTPAPDLDHDQTRRLALLGHEAHDLRRQQYVGDETTHVFVFPWLAVTSGASIATSMVQLDREFNTQSSRMASIQQEIDEEVARCYGLTLDEFAQAYKRDAIDLTAESNEETDEDSEETALSDVASRVEEVLQWALGCILGRWDVRIALDHALIPALQGPFKPLPVCSPGTLVGPDGLPARSGGIVSVEWLQARPSVIALSPEGSVAEPTISDAAYPLRIDWDGILVDDEGHPDDIVTRVRDVFSLLWGERGDAIEQEACEILNVANLREYFRNPRRFWEFHVKRYSKSRRKAPIYWLLQSSKRSYGLWLYYHRMDSDILYKALRTYVDPKIARERHRLEELEAGRTSAEAAGGRTRRDHERLVDRQRSLLTELEGFRQTLEQVALLDLTVDHDDGVILSIAPLHELVPWKPANQAWNELVAGKYEWSTMAKRMREKGLVRGSGRQ